MMILMTAKKGLIFASAPPRPSCYDQNNLELLKENVSYLSAGGWGETNRSLA